MQELNSSQFTIVVGNNINSEFPSGHIILTSDSLCNISVDDKNVLASENSAEKNSTTSDKKDIPSTIKDSLIVKKPEYQEINVEDRDKNCINVNFEENIFAPNTKHSLIGYENMEEDMNIKTNDKIASINSPTDSPFVNETNFHLSSAKGDVCVSPTNSELFWKTSNKNQKADENSDLVVETADFFSLVLSPGKSLPSPSEKLKHLSLSSPVDTLLGYEDDGLYQLLLNPDNATTSENNSGDNIVQHQTDTIETTGNNNNNTQTLETINEESLKHLLYGSSRS